MRTHHVLPPLTAAAMASLLLALTACPDPSVSTVTPPPTPVPAPTPVSAPAPSTPQANGPTQACAPPLPTALSLRNEHGTLVYVQQGPGTDDTALGRVPHQDLCLSVDGQPPRLLVHGRESPPDAGVETTLADFANFQFSLDERSLYFSSTAWVTSPAIHVVDLATGAERYVTDGATVFQLTSGPYRGDIAVVHAMLDPDHEIGAPGYRGRIAVEYVHTLDGKRVRRLPDDEKARAKALSGT